MTNEITIPLLPCRSITDTLIFYTALGFEITYQQTRPNNYACVRRGGINLHFFALKELDPAQSYSSCLVLVPDVDAIYAAFAAGLRQHYGKLLVAGIPRINKPNNNNAAGDRRFNVIDPGGNWIRFVQKAAEEEGDGEPTSSTGEWTKFSRALHTAEMLANSKGDYAAAAKVLDVTLAHDEPDAAIQRIPLLLLRAEVAVTMEDAQLATTILSDIRQMPLRDEERAALAEAFGRADDLEQMLK